MQNLFDNFEQLELSVKSCNKCSLCETRINTVIADGNPNAKLMLIGEGPGEQEDLNAIPFVGKAGKLLDKILEAVDINRQEETYICNVIKCRPPNNRVPSESEAQACWDYLYHQIKFVKPKIILFLGTTALKYALDLKDPKITKLHGKWLTLECNNSKAELFKDCLLMPFYHPSYLLRNPSKEIGQPKWQAWQAIKEVKAKLIKA